MDPATQYDAIVIGAGQAGGPLAGALARAGRRSALVERVHVGGTCINEGCTPTKTMVASARVAYLARRAADYGVRAGPVVVDMAAVRQRKRSIVESFRSGSERRLTTTAGLDLLIGEARFIGPNAVEVRSAAGTKALTAPLIFINTGGRPARPALQGLDAVPTLDSTSIMELAVLPEHLLILGGGSIGLEFGQMFRRFGTRVTVVQRPPRLEPGVPGVYALGDVKGGPAFTHIHYDDFRIVRTNLLEGGSATIHDRLVPNTVFIDPQLGRIGLSEAEAREQGRKIQVAKMPMSYVARALEMDEPRGFMKAVVDADTGLILGAAVLGVEGGEIMAALQVAMLGRLPYTALRDAVFAHPTLAESFNNLFAALV